MNESISDIQVGLANSSDFAQILSLQKQHLITNLSECQKLDGFLSIEFTESMLEEVVNDLVIIKAFTNEKLVGYRMAQTLKFNQRFPLIAAIIEKFPTLELGGKRLSTLRAFISGPVCIAKEWRGKGVNQLMFKCLLEHVQLNYDVGVTFVSENNPRSLAAANKNGFKLIDKINFLGKAYNIFAFSTAS